MAGRWRSSGRKQGFASIAAGAAMATAMCLSLLLFLASAKRYIVSIREDSPLDHGQIEIGAPFIPHSSQNKSIAIAAAARNLRWQAPAPALDHAADGLSGPFSLVDRQELELILPRILHDWEELRPRLTERMARAGFEAPSDRSCFLYLEDCLNLARHKSIVEAVEGIVGRGGPVLLYGLRVWSAPPMSQQVLEVTLEGFQCQTVDVLVNSGARIVRNSHTLTKQMAIRLANQIKAVRRFYGDESPLLRQRIESVTVMHLADKVEGATVQEMGLEPGGAYTINGRLLYVTSNPTETVQTSLLLQFVPAGCSLRDQEVDSSRLALLSRPVIPPTLLASAGAVNLSWDAADSDVRRGLARDEVLDSEEEVAERREHALLGMLPGSNLTILRRRVREIGSPGVYEIARSPLLDWITVEKLAFKQTEVAFKSSTVDQLLVVVRGTLNYHHAGRGYREVKELKGGELTFLSSSDLHALTSRAGAEYIRISWAGKGEGSTPARKKFSNGKQVFQMPVKGLGAINARAVGLRPGQAYDPENEADCDVLVIVLKGAHLQVVPSQEFVQASEAVFIPAGEACILWNSGVLPAAIVSLQLYAALQYEDRDSCYLEANYRTRGKVM